MSPALNGRSVVQRIKRGNVIRIYDGIIKLRIVHNTHACVHFFHSSITHADENCYVCCFCIFWTLSLHESKLKIFFHNLYYYFETVLVV